MLLSKNEVHHIPNKEVVDRGAEGLHVDFNGLVVKGRGGQVVV